MSVTQKYIHHLAAQEQAEKDAHEQQERSEGERLALARQVIRERVRRRRVGGSQRVGELQGTHAQVGGSVNGASARGQARSDKVNGSDKRPAGNEFKDDSHEECGRETGLGNDIEAGSTAARADEAGSTAARADLGLVGLKSRPKNHAVLTPAEVGTTLISPNPAHRKSVNTREHTREHTRGHTNENTSTTVRSTATPTPPRKARELPQRSSDYERAGHVREDPQARYERTQALLERTEAAKAALSAKLGTFESEYLRGDFAVLSPTDPSRVVLGLQSARNMLQKLEEEEAGGAGA
jgi:hypothetical protein